METITKDNLKKIKKRLSFYNFEDNVSATGEIIIKFRKDLNITTYSDIQYGGRYEDFELQADILKRIIIGIICNINPESVVITKYQPKWIVNSSISHYMANWFRDNGLRINFSGAIRVYEKEIIEKFIIENFKYNSFTQYLIPNSEIIITPTDHLDIFIVSRNIENTFKIVNKIINMVDVKNQIIVYKE